MHETIEKSNCNPSKKAKPLTANTQDDATELKLSYEDITGRTLAAATKRDKTFKLQRLMFTRWQQFHRAVTLHRQPTIFGPNSTNTLKQRFHFRQLPEKFRHLVTTPIPPIFQETKHFSPHTLDILHDGVIYSQQVAVTPKGISLRNDKLRFDYKLVFTSPISEFTQGNITFSLPTLLAHNQDNRLYFKFYDWTRPLAFSVKLSPDITLSMSYLEQHTKFVISTTARQSFLIKVAPEELVYHSNQGLDEYLTFFIFKLLERLPFDAMPLKNAVYDYFETLDKQGALLTHLQSIMKVLLHNAEIDFIGPLELNFQSIKSFSIDNDVVNFEDIRSVISVDDLLRLKQLISHPAIGQSYFIIKGMLNFALQQGSIEIINYLTVHYEQILSYEHHAKLVQRAQKIYDRHLSKKYKDVHLYNIDAELHIAGEMIARPNHNLTRLRVARYIEDILDYLRKFGQDPNLRYSCEHLSPRIVLEMRTMLLYSITGRECDIGFTGDPNLYNRYRQASADNFRQHALEENYPPHEVECYATLVCFLGNPEFLQTVRSSDPHSAYLLQIMDFAHKLDLMRCYGLEHYLHSVEAINKELVIPSNRQEQALNDLFKMVDSSIRATGGRLMCSYVEGGMRNIRVNYDPERFVWASKDPMACLRFLLNKDAKRTVIFAHSKMTKYENLYNYQPLGGYHKSSFFSNSTSHTKIDSSIQENYYAKENYFKEKLYP